MKRLAQCILVLTVTLALGAPAVTAVEAPTVRAPGEFDPGALLARQQELADWLGDRRPAGVIDRALEVAISEEELAAAERDPAARQRVLVGVARSLAMPIDLSGPPPVGVRRDLPGGGFVWSLAIRGVGASALRVGITGLALPPGSALYVYDRDGQAFGPYRGAGPRGDGDLWTHTIFGDELILQLHAGGTGPAPRLVLDEIGVMGARFLLPAFVEADGAEAFCSFNEPCVENAECGGTDAAVADARDAVAQILFRSGGFFFICSGGLLADTAGTQTPFFLTANHCLSKSREADTMEAFFQFTTPCGGACYDPDGVVPSTLGATILASDRTSDYTLMELAEPAPSGSAFLGWTSTPISGNDGADLFRISHPAGAPQAYSEHSVDTSAPTCSGWPRGEWIYSRDTFGATEGGSSGSPVVNAGGQVVGQLSGACGFDVNDPCNSVDNATVDGAFAAYFADVSQWLEADGDGGGGGGGGSCDLGLPGDPCADDADCCSGKCKGKPGAKTCK